VICPRLSESGQERESPNNKSLEPLAGDCSSTPIYTLMERNQIKIERKSPLGLWKIGLCVFHFLSFLVSWHVGQLIQ